MKNTKTMLILCVMMLALCSCSNKNNESVSNNTSSPTDIVATNITTTNPTEEPTEPPTAEPTATPTKKTAKKKKTQKYDDTLDGIEKYFSDKELLTGERTKKEASMIGGIDGFAYAESDIEIYEYDINSEEYKSLSNGEGVPIEGMENYSVTADAINGKFILLSDSQKIINAFNNFNN